MKKVSYRLFIIGLIGLLIFSVLLSLCVGRYWISIPDVAKILFSRVFHYTKTWEDMAESVVYTLRVPRVLGAILVGGGLALSGASYQGVFKNPLVSPDLLGVSSGACVGAALAILLGFGGYGIQFFAFLFGVATVALTALIPRLIRNSSMTMLVISGVIVSGIMNSLLGLMKYLADPETQLAEITYWQLGSLAKVTSSNIRTLAPTFIAGCVVILLIRWQINILSLGEAEAKSLGVHVGLVRGVIVFCATMLTASAVCMCGTIGWVGLVIPHLSRMTAGADNVKSIPASFLMGAIFMLLIDTAARALTSMELPLSILTGLIGAPFYLYILAKQRMKLS